MSKDGEKIFTAVSKVGTSLQGLSSDEQQKVLDGVAVLLGLQVGSRNDNKADEQSNDEESELNGKKKIRVSLVEYVKQKVPATNAQAIVVFAAYRESYEGKENFSKDDLEPYFGRARIPSPRKNYSRDYYTAVKDGWIHDDGANSYLTQSGTSVVEAGFAGKAKPRGRAKAKKVAKKG